ncbi:MAG: phosphoribosyltransferase [Nanobdellota archaeon]
MELTWQEIESLIEGLASKVRGYSPDIVVAIGMGGWIPARLLKKYIAAEYYTLICSYYDENNQKTDKVRVIQDIGVNISSKRVLLLDEVADSGETLKKVDSYLRSLGPSKLKTAVIHKKSHSSFEPDLVAKDIGSEWIVYPWE